MIGSFLRGNLFLALVEIFIHPLNSTKMKQNLFVLNVFTAFLFSITSCKDNSSKLTKEDSTNIGNILLKNRKLKHTHTFERLEHNFIPPQKIGDPDSIKNMITCYKKYPLIFDPNTNANTEYFLLDSNDWDELIKIHKQTPIKSLKFQLGIKNYNEVNSDEEDPIYTIMTFSIDKKSGQSSITAYDYACPCPGSKCCPL